MNTRTEADKDHDHRLKVVGGVSKLLGEATAGIVTVTITVATLVGHFSTNKEITAENIDKTARKALKPETELPDLSAGQGYYITDTSKYRVLAAQRPEEFWQLPEKAIPDPNAPKDEVATILVPRFEVASAQINPETVLTKEQAEGTKIQVKINEDVMDEIGGTKGSLEVVEF